MNKTNPWKDNHKNVVHSWRLFKGLNHGGKCETKKIKRDITNGMWKSGQNHVLGRKGLKIRFLGQFRILKSRNWKKLWNCFISRKYGYVEYCPYYWEKSVEIIRDEGHDVTYFQTVQK